MSLPERYDDYEEGIRQARDELAELDRQEAAFLAAVAFIRGPDAIRPGEWVAVLCRVTTLTQKRNGSLDRQKQAVRKAVREQGGRVRVVFGKAGVAGDCDRWLRILETAFRRAADRGLEKVVVSELSRLARSPDYGNHDWRAGPSPEQLGRIQHMAEEYGLTVVSVLPPQAGFRQERSFQTKRSGRCGRRPGSKTAKALDCKGRRQLFQKTALEAVDAGKSYREAAEVVNKAMACQGYGGRPVSYITVYRWDKRRKEG
jgi:hypothetical protein